jgi:hypothetical protein
LGGLLFRGNFFAFGVDRIFFIVDVALPDEQTIDEQKRIGVRLDCPAPTLGR